MSGFRLAYEKGEKRAVVCRRILLMYKQIDTAGGRKSLDGFWKTNQRDGRVGGQGGGNKWVEIMRQKKGESGKSGQVSGGI